MMKCPECQVAFIIKRRQSLKVNECPQCHRIWLKSGDIEKMTTKTQVIEKKNRSNSLTNKDKAIPTKKRKIIHFLSGAFDISNYT
jgi:Zn-finger nucleic acid-binding protein